MIFLPPGSSPHKRSDWKKLQSSQSSNQANDNGLKRQSLTYARQQGHVGQLRIQEKSHFHMVTQILDYKWRRASKGCTRNHMAKINKTKNKLHRRNKHLHPVSRVAIFLGSCGLPLCCTPLSGIRCVLKIIVKRSFGVGIISHSGE